MWVTQNDVKQHSQKIFPNYGLLSCIFPLLTGIRCLPLTLNKRAKMALDRSPEFFKPFFSCHFQRRIYKNFFMSVQCKKPPFTNTGFSMMHKSCINDAILFQLTPLMNSSASSVMQLSLFQTI